MMSMQNGDYVLDGHGGFASTSSEEEILQNTLFQLTARKNAFPLLPDLGSHLYRLPNEKPSKRQELAKQYIEEALSFSEDLELEHVVWDESEGEVTLFLNSNNQKREISLSL